MSLKIYTNDHKENTTIQKLWKSTTPDWIECGMSKQDMKDLLKLTGVKIKGFIGGVEQPISILAEDVPASFPNSIVSVDESTTRQKVWDEYCNYRVSNDSTKVLMSVGYVDANGNRKDEVDFDELKEWITYFGEDNILTKSEFKVLLQSTDYTINEEQ